MVPPNMFQKVDTGRELKQGIMVHDIVKKEVERDEPTTRKSLEQPPISLSSSSSSPSSLPSPTSSSSMVSGPDTPPKGKERYRVTVSYKDQVQKICWYGEDTPSKTIEDVIRTAFGLPHQASLLLKNADDDIVAVSSSLPANELFTLHVNGYNGSSRSREDDEPMVEEVVERGEERLKKEEEDDEEDSQSEGSPSPSPHSSPSPSSLAIVNIQSRVDTPSPIAIKTSPHHISRSPPMEMMDSEPATRYPVLIESTPPSERILALKREVPTSLRDEKIKRKRRKAIEIERSYKCSVGTCHKVYGSENALKMHIKLKHPDFVNLVPVVMVNSHISSDYPSSHSHPSHPPSHHGPPQHHTPSHHTLPHHVTPPPNHHMHHPSSYTYRQFPMSSAGQQGPSTPPPPSSSHMIARTSSYGTPSRSPFGVLHPPPQFPPAGVRMSTPFSPPHRSDREPPHHMGSHPPPHGPPHGPPHSHQSLVEHPSARSTHLESHPSFRSHPSSHSSPHPSSHPGHPDSHHPSSRDPRDSHPSRDPRDPLHSQSRDLRDPHLPPSRDPRDSHHLSSRDPHHPPPRDPHHPSSRDPRDPHHLPPRDSHPLSRESHPPPRESHSRDSHLLPPRESHPLSSRESHPLPPRESHSLPPRESHPLSSRDSHPLSSRDSHLPPRESPPPRESLPPRESHTPRDSIPPRESHNPRDPHHPPPRESHRASSSVSRDLPTFNTMLPPIHSIPAFVSRHAPLPSLSGLSHKEGREGNRPSSPSSSSPPSHPASQLPSVSSIVGPRHSGEHPYPPSHGPTTTTTTTTITENTSSPPKKESFSSHTSISSITAPSSSSKFQTSHFR